MPAPLSRVPQAVRTRRRRRHRSSGAQERTTCVREHTCHFVKHVDAAVREHERAQGTQRGYGEARTGSGGSGEEAGCTAHLSVGVVPYDGLGSDSLSGRPSRPPFPLPFPFPVSVSVPVPLSFPLPVPLSLSVAVSAARGRMPLPASVEAFLLVLLMGMRNDECGWRGGIRRAWG